MTMGMVAMMSNPGNMTGLDMLLMFVIMCGVACIPIVLAIVVISLRLIGALIKWLLVGACVYVGFRVMSWFARLDMVTTFTGAFKEAYNKKA